MLIRRPFTALLAIATLALLFAGSPTAHAWPPGGNGGGGGGNGGGGNGGGGEDPPPEPPPVQYQITWIDYGLDQIVVEAMSNNGAVVGSVGDRAFRFTPEEGVVILNDEIDPESGWDLDQARDINQWGQIVGQGGHNGERRAYRLSPTDLDGDGFPDIDDLGTLYPNDTHSNAWGINEFGEVCGWSRDATTDIRKPYLFADDFGMVEIPAVPGLTYAFDINNYGEVVGQSNGVVYRYSAATDTVEYFSSPDGIDTELFVWAINDDGHFVGKAQFVAPKGKKHTDFRAYIYRNGADLEDMGAPEFLSARGINAWGDVVLRNSGAAVDGMVYLQEFDALFKLDDAVTGSEGDLQTWYSTNFAIPVDINDDGEIAGFFAGSPLGFLLTPIPPAP